MYTVYSIVIFFHLLKERPGTEGVHVFRLMEENGVHRESPRKHEDMQIPHRKTPDLKHEATSYCEATVL